MKFKSLCLACAAALAASVFAAAAFAQPAPSDGPIDGQLVRLDVKKLWRFAFLPNAPLLDSQRIGKGIITSSISPDGSQAVMFERGKPQEPNILHRWANGKTNKILESRDVSSYIEWADDHQIDIRETNAPFFRDGAKLRYEVSAKPKLKTRLPHADSQFVVYDHDDVIILESKKTRTLQAISDPAADRYYAPMLSPDERFVAFSGLRSGVLVFDIEANAIVFIGSHGTDPSFSPDGRYLIYADTRDDGHAYTQANLVLVDLHKRTYRILANPNHEIRLRASLSRNAEFVSYTTIDGDAYRAKIDK